MGENSYKNWQEKTLIPYIKKNPTRKKKFETSSYLDVKELYADSDVKNYEQNLGYPGQYPFTRGPYPTMYRGQFWTMRQYAGFGTAKESNERYKYLLKQGQTGLSVAFDLPTQIGYDSDSPMSEGEVGKVGVAIDTIDDMETLFKDIPLDKVSTSMTINATAFILLAMYIVVGKKQGVDKKLLRGTIQNDILKEYIARGTYIYPPKPSMRIITDIFDYCAKEVPKWNTISISGYHIREAGSTAVQEAAFTLANGIEYVKSAIDKGLNVDEFAGRLSFFFNAHNDILEEVAKFRAARRMWAKIMKERFQAKNEKSQMLRFHTQTGGSTLTAQQPENNIVRVTLQALAAVLGGTQSLHTNSMDEALALPTEKSVRIALRTQQIIAYESGVANVVDPLGGSYYIESLTDTIEEKAWEYINKIDELGGMVAAIEQGFVQKEIQESAFQYQMDIENKERIIVGVNSFQIEEEPPKDLLKVDPSLRNEQIKNLQRVKSQRDNTKVLNNIKLLKETVQSNENIMPVVIECVENYATLQEIADALRQEFGEYKESVVI
ncbi:Methylmalonyl-CoA mutase [Desulfurella amilsii]|uniref:methylmalonyl-CoA mutase n=1 Tax=Desulfurella amilsii TaxID=1562698 RepID=A0A1X4XWQ9_9BACT|nr:methylmalonyl-CoA mutase family protein [Desulfurella amilsii]OSS41954.1 Methylmalonyl-CoA mutase [Desulfurella amilsii]